MGCMALFIFERYCELDTAPCKNVPLFFVLMGCMALFIFERYRELDTAPCKNVPLTLCTNGLRGFVYL